MIFFINATIIRFICVVLFITMFMCAHKHTYNLLFLNWLRKLSPILSLLTRENILEESSGGPMTHVSVSQLLEESTPGLLARVWLWVGLPGAGTGVRKGFLLNTTAAASNNLSKVHCEKLRFN